MTTLLKVWRIRSSKHKTDKYVAVFLYFIGNKDGESLTYVCIHRELHLVDSFWANILVRNNLLGPERISIDIANKKAHIGSCSIIIFLDAKQKSSFVCKKLLTQKGLTLSPRNKAMVPFVSAKLPDDWDFFMSWLLFISTLPSLFILWIII